MASKGPRFGLWIDHYDGAASAHLIVCVGSAWIAPWQSRTAPVRGFQIDMQQQIAIADLLHQRAHVGASADAADDFKGLLLGSSSH
ncbi:hypothetical protein LMH87_005869 [Akanthomyces muscarius]|uniref:Uncharacterized protein n=1 Tax=Akanthomyces muscarius TaxID=2231603 RepID=A0A9W8USB0_AKAMU|nr:hypothetical protein LMH87_005869 [Akanthomyces muscarius]KAJ4164185.1 hypothetical protein LMH87_005869 [Akanthomyces muscarius]